MSVGCRLGSECWGSVDHSYSLLSASISPNERSGPKTEQLDRIICHFLAEQRVPGATLAVAHHGHVVYEQGYGVAGAGRRMRARTALRLASISKSITAIAVLRLCQEGKLSLDATVFGANGILKRLKPRGDKHLSLVTVRHLLQHSAGWDRDIAGDAVFWKVPLRSGVKTTSPQYNSLLLQHVLNRKLQFKPGSRHAYSNLGYLALGEVIEAVTGQSYESYVTPLMSLIGVTDMYVGGEQRAYWQSSEGEYFNNGEPATAASVMPGQEDSTVLPQYGSYLMGNTGAFGGWVATARDVLLILSDLEAAFNHQPNLCGKDEEADLCPPFPASTGSQPLKTAPTLLNASMLHCMLQCPSYESGRDWYGLGLDVQDQGNSWGHTGAMEGTCCTMQRHHSGVSWAFVLNAWAAEMDLDGVVKLALSTVEQLSPFSCSVAGMCGEMLCVTTKDEYQCIMAHVPLEKLLLEVEARKLKGYKLVWVGANSASQKRGRGLTFNMIFCKSDQDVELEGKLLNIEANQLQKALSDCYNDGFHPDSLTMYSDGDTAFGMAVLSQVDRYCMQMVDVRIPAEEYVQLLTKRKEHNFHVLHQCVTECRQSQMLLVTAVMEKESVLDKAFSNRHVKKEDLRVNVAGAELTNEIRSQDNANEQIKNKAAGQFKAEADSHFEIDGQSLDNRNRAEAEDREQVTTRSDGEVKEGQIEMEDNSFIKTKRRRQSEQSLREDSGQFVREYCDLRKDSNKRKRKISASVAEDSFQDLELTPSSQPSESCESLCFVSSSPVNSEYHHVVAQRQQSLGSVHHAAIPKTPQASQRSRKRRRLFSTVKKSKNKNFWLQMTVDQFVAAMTFHLNNRRGLQDVHFYPAGSDWFVSGVWSRFYTHNCYFRMGMSHQGLLPALAEAAARNVQLRFLCQYEEEGTLHYALFWEAPQFGKETIDT